jgi:hypothetical protein
MPGDILLARQIDEALRATGHICLRDLDFVVAAGLPICRARAFARGKISHSQRCADDRVQRAGYNPVQERPPFARSEANRLRPSGIAPSLSVSPRLSD